MVRLLPAPHFLFELADRSSLLSGLSGKVILVTNSVTTTFTSTLSRRATEILHRAMILR
jgi:hypothetical protein